MNTATDTMFFRNIQKLCSERGMSVTALGQAIGLSNATTSGWRNKGSLPRGKTLKMIADYFSVSIDQLIDEPKMNLQYNNDVMEHTYANVTIINGSERKLCEQESALLGIFEKLDVVKKAQLLSFAADLDK